MKEGSVVLTKMALLDSFTPEAAQAVGARFGVGAGLASALVPLVVLLLGALLGVVLERFLLNWLHRSAALTRTKLDDVLATSLQGPVRVVITLLAGVLALLLSPLPEPARVWLARAYVVLVGIGAVILAARTLGGMVLVLGGRVGEARWFLRRLVVLGAYLVGGLLILDNLGVEITPLLTTLGLAGLAVALALQDTLSNLFAGLYVQSDRPLGVGHYVRLDDLNVEGFVTEVGWRTTKVRTLANNLVVIPNSRVASSVVTDYDLPEPRMSLLVRVPVPRGTDAKRVEKILVEEALETSKHVKGLLDTPPPFVRFIPGFTESGLEFTLICQVSTFVDQYEAQHELRKRIAERLEKEGIETSLPGRLIELRGGSNGHDASARLAATGERAGGR